MSWSVVEAPAGIARVVTRLMPTRSGAIGCAGQRERYVVVDGLSMAAKFGLDQ
jgi:hypothetical protein